MAHGPERLQHLKAVKLRQACVQEQKVKPFPRQQPHGLRAIPRDQGIKAPKLHTRRDPAGRSSA